MHSISGNKSGGVLGLRVAVFVALLLAPGPGTAQIPDPGDGGKADDAVRNAILSGSSVPMSILAIRQRLVGDLKGTLTPHIVVNGGHDNPSRGKPAGTPGVRFMVFETYAGPPGVDADELFTHLLKPPRRSH